jgi:hemerythrin-like metal-binding protein
MELGIDSMDVQHKRWIELTNNLHESVRKKEDNDIVGQTIKDILDYTHTHFADEERLMSENGYPDYAHHKKLHDELINKLNNIQDRLKNGHLVLTVEVAILLSNWLGDHIKGVDKLYAPFLKEKGVL